MAFSDEILTSISQKSIQCMPSVESAKCACERSKLHKPMRGNKFKANLKIKNNKKEQRLGINELVY